MSLTNITKSIRSVQTKVPENLSIDLTTLYPSFDFFITCSSMQKRKKMTLASNMLHLMYLTFA